MPFGPYTDFDDCVAKNSDKSSPEGFCAWLHKQITGAYPSQMSSELPLDAWPIYLEAYGAALQASKKRIEDAERDANDLAVRSLNEAGWIHSRIGWVKQYAAPKFKTVVNVRVFSSGTWTDSAGVTREWTDQMLDELVLAFNAGVPSIVPLKAGHTPDTFNQIIAEKLGIPVDVVTGDHGKGQISIGRMATLERRGNLLMASFERVPEQIADLIEGGQYSTVSVETEDAVGDFASVITAVALLGAEEPAVDQATLDRALVFGGKRENAHVLSFSMSDTEYLEREFETLREKMSETIKGMRGAPVFRAMLSNLRALFDQLTKRREHQAPDVPPEVVALAAAEHQGNVEALISWVGRVGFNQCVATLTGKPDVTDPVKVCGWLKGRAHQLSMEDETMPKSLAELKAGFQEPTGAGAEAVAALAAIYAALGLPEDATPDDAVAAIEKLMAAPAAEGEMAQKFQKASDRIATLEGKIAKRESEDSWLERVSTFTAIPNMGSKDIAVELANVEEKLGSEAAEKQFSRFEEFNKMGEAVTKILGSSKPGPVQVDFEDAVKKYQQEHDKATRLEASKAVRRLHPELRNE